MHALPPIDDPHHHLWLSSLLHTFVSHTCFRFLYMFLPLKHAFVSHTTLSLPYLILCTIGTYRDSAIGANKVSLVPPKPLEQRVARLEDLLVQRVRARLVAIFSSCVTSATPSSTTATTASTSAMTGEDSIAAASSSSSESKDSSPSPPSSSSSSSSEPHHSEEFPSRAFAHCLRALVALSRGEVRVRCDATLGYIYGYVRIYIWIC